MGLDLALEASAAAEKAVITKQENSALTPDGKLQKTDCWPFEPMFKTLLEASFIF